MEARVLVENEGRDRGRARVGAEGIEAGKPSNLLLFAYNTYSLTTRFLGIPMDSYDPVAIIELGYAAPTPEGGRA